VENAIKHGVEPIDGVEPVDAIAAEGAVGHDPELCGWIQPGALPAIVEPFFAASSTASYAAGGAVLMHVPEGASRLSS